MLNICIDCSIFILLLLSYFLLKIPYLGNVGKNDNYWSLISFFTIADLIFRFTLSKMFNWKRPVNLPQEDPTEEAI